MNEEYQALREEIMFSMQTVKNYRSLLYTIVVAVLAFAVDKGEAILFLVPFVAIVPIYLLSMHQIDSTMRIGAYIYVFLEPNLPVGWETRLYVYDQLYKNEYGTKKTSIDSYLVLSFLCIIMSIVNMDFNNKDYMFYIIVFLQIVISIVCIFIFIKKRPDYLKVKEKYIADWKRVKSIEDTEE